MSRLTHAWRALQREQRLAALCSLGLFVSMLLPWYSKTNTVVVRNAASATQQSLSAFQAFSFVEAAVLLVSAGVLTMLFARAEQSDFHLPGGDGTIVMIAGGWAALLIFYRLLDKPGLQGNQKVTSTVGVEWGIFIALLLALALLYAGGRIRAAEQMQAQPARTNRREREARGFDEETVRRSPDRPGGERAGGEPSEEATAIVAAPALPRRATPASARSPRAPGPARDQGPARGRPRFPPAPSEQMSFEEESPNGE
jgi:hypothetical protein